MLLGCIIALGLFVRFTFAGFVAPAVAYHILGTLPPVRVGKRCVCDAPRHACVRVASVSSAGHALSERVARGARSAVFVVAGFLATCVPLAALDTWYYESPVRVRVRLAPCLGSLMPHLTNSVRCTQTLVIKPLTLLLYNLDPSNLAQHGTHPRWLHAIVNMPMLYGPPLLLAVLAMATSAKKEGDAVAPATNAGTCGRSYSVAQLMTATVVVRGGGIVNAEVSRPHRLGWVVQVPLALLSAAPHQEPRFLVPLVVPVAVLAGLVVSRWTKQHTSWLRLVGVRSAGAVAASRASCKRISRCSPSSCTPLCTLHHRWPHCSFMWCWPLYSAVSTTVALSRRPSFSSRRSIQTA